MNNNYACSCCHAKAVKLWRSILEAKLLCAKCLAEENKFALSEISPKGTRTIPFVKHPLTVRTVGSYIPAIPNKFSGYYNSYAEAPEDLKHDWTRLPLENK
jgi:hypothetical protein